MPRGDQHHFLNLMFFALFVLYATSTLHVRPCLLGGTLGTLLGLRPALWIATLGGLTGFLLLLPSPLPGFRMP